jgi:PAS domain S-box-containing protein
LFVHRDPAAALEGPYYANGSRQDQGREDGADRSRRYFGFAPVAGKTVYTRILNTTKETAMIPESVRPTILIVEDEALIAMNEQAILKRHGYEAVYVTKGSVAIESVRTMPEIGLVLMDIDLGPGIDGTIAAESILKIRELPVVFLSSHTEPEVVEKTERITSYGYIVKNSGETVLVASVKMAFRLFDARCESKRHETLLQQSEERFRALFENAPLGYQSLDADGRFLQVNDAWLNTFGYDRDEVIGRSFGDFLVSNGSAAFAERFAGFKKRGQIQTAFEMQRKSGEIRYITFEGRVGTDQEGRFQQTHCILRDETERRRTAEALERSEAFQRKMVENIQDVIVIIDRDGIVRYKSPNIQRLFGWSPEEIVGKTAWDNVHPDDQAAVLELFHALSTNSAEVPSLRCRYRHKDGTFRWIQFTGTNRFDDPDIAGIIGNYHDVTEQIHWEQRVEASIYELNKSQEVANVGNWVWHIPENSLEWSDQMYRIFGIDKQRFVGDLARVLTTSIHPDDRAAVEASNASVISRKAPIPLEYRVIRPDGTIRTVWAEAGELELGDDGEPILLRGIVLDITEQKRTEGQLHERTYIFSKSEELTQSGGWKWDISENRFTFTEGWMRVHGTDRPSMDRNDLLSLAHPSDRSAIQSAFDAALREHRPYKIEHRIIRHDTGEERMIRALGEVVHDSNGVPTQMFGAAQDITEEKRREGLLKIRQDAINASMDAIALADLDGSLNYVNPAFLSLWGYDSAEQVLGKTSTQFWEVADRSQHVIDALKTNGFWTGNLVAKRSDGSLFDAQLSSSMVTDGEGVPICLMGIFRDITESQLAENRINALLQEKDLMLKETHHRIKNNFAIIESLLNLQAEATSHPEASVSLRNASARVANMRVLYERLLLTDEHRFIPVRAYFRELTTSILAAYVDSDRIDLRSQIDEFELDSRALFPLGTIVAELLTNSLKHAYAPEDTGVIDLSLVGETASWTLTIRDYGKGVPKPRETSLSGSFGLMLVRMLSEQVDARFTMTPANGGGTMCTVAHT